MKIYKLEITAIEIIPEYNTYKNVIKKIYWKRILTKNINNIEYNLYTEGSKIFLENEITNFIEYSEIHNEDIYKWLFDNINFIEIDEFLNNEIENNINKNTIIYNFNFKNKE